MHRHRHPAAGEAGRLGQAEHLLQADRQDGSLGISVVHPDAGAGGDGQVGRGEPLQRPPLLPAQEPEERGTSVQLVEVRAPADRPEVGTEPLLEPSQEGRVVHRRPGITEVVTAEGEPFPERAPLLAPAQSAEAVTTDLLQDRRAEEERVRIAEWPLLQHDRPEPEPPDRLEGIDLPLPGHRVLPLQLIGEQPHELFPFQRCAQPDPALPWVAVELGGDHELRALDRGGLGEGPLPVAEQETTGLAGAPRPDAVGIGQRQERPDGERRSGASASQGGLPRGRFLPGAAQPPAIHREPVPGGRRLSPGDQLQSEADIGIALARGAPEDVAVLEQGRETGGNRNHAVLACQEEQVRQAGMGSQLGHAPPVGGDAARLIQRPQLPEQRSRLGQRGGGRGVKPPERRRVGDPGGRQLQRERRQVGLEDLGGIPRQEVGVLPLGPEPVADARGRPPGAPPPLVGRRPGDPDGREPRHAVPGREPRHARQAAVDHHANPFDRQAALRDRGREHHLSPARRAGQDRGVLGLPAHHPVERPEIARDRAREPFCQEFGGAADLGLAGEEDQHVALGLGQRAADRRRRVHLDPPLRPAREVPGVDREAAARARYDRGVAEQRGDGGTIERRRHDEHPQVGAQHRPRFQHQRQPQVGLQAAFMEFVEDDEPGRGQLRVVLHHPGQDALGEHLDPGAWPHLGFAPDAEADRLPDAFAEQRGHPAGRGAGGEAPRLEHQDPPPPEPVGGPERERDQRRLPRPGGRLQHGDGSAAEHALQLRQDGRDRQGGRVHAGKDSAPAA